MNWNVIKIEKFLKYIAMIAICVLYPVIVLVSIALAVFLIVVFIPVTIVILFFYGWFLTIQSAVETMRK
jgi:hypothetical protein